ncbi:hypothetical protein KR222_010654 [Zaprionus bogoriensis]|nr:hypothetical protein KR222_010654 [Zaprionus bogoriensis]
MAGDDDNGFADWVSVSNICCTLQQLKLLLQGGYFEAKKSKLEEQFAAASDPFRKSNLFAGVSIFVNGLTNPSADELKRIMMVHGGTFHHYERPHTNFIIASNLPDVKVRKMDTSKIISAQWVVDCVDQKRLLDYKPYLLYTNQKTTQPRLNFGKSKSGNNSTMDAEYDALQLQLGGILKELQHVVATSPDKNSSNLSVTSTTASSNSTAAKTAVDPAFLGEFYKNSRLHHIATLGAGFKQYVCELRQAHGNQSFPKRAELRLQQQQMPLAAQRYVMHIDMDCFFVSVGLRNQPELRGLPIAVTHSKGGSAATDVPVHPQADRQVEQELFAQRFEQHMHDNIRADKVRSGFDKKMSLSEIASCSYEARAKGIKNGMFVGQALKLCPELKTIPYDFEGYREVAYALYDTVAQYTLNIEAVSCDEMFVELTDLVQELQVDVMSFVTHLRQEVRDKTGCPCSAGVGDNKLLARMATKLAKPNGQHLLETEDAATYMGSLALDVLPGVGSSMTYKLNQAGLTTCADVQQVSLVRLEMLLGKKMAQTLYQNCRGIDPRPLVYEQQRKSVSAEVNYGIRFAKHEELEKFLRQLSVEVHSRLVEIKRKAKSITLKLMVRAAEAPIETSKYMGHGVCDNQTKSTLLKQSTDDVAIITEQVLKLMKESGFPPHELRGIGIHLSKLDEAVDAKKENTIKNMFVKMSEKQKALKHPEVETKPKPNVLSMLKNAAATSVKKPMTYELAAGGTEREIRTKESKCVNVLSMLQSAASARKPIEYDFAPANVVKECAPASVGLFDADVLAQLPDEIRHEILSYPDEYLRIADTEKPHEQSNYQEYASSHSTQRKGKRRSPPYARSRSRSTSTPPPPPPPLIRVTSTHVSPLNESDLKPSTSKAALVKQKQRQKSNCRSDQIVTEYVQELPRHMHPAILQYLQQNETVPIVAESPSKTKPVTPVKSNSNSNSSSNDNNNNNNVLVDSNYKSMLATWVKTEPVPKPADVDLMYMNICCLVEDNKMDEVYEVMKYLCRLIKAKRASCCRWHMAYNEIESNIQEKVHEVLDCHIYFTEAIDCFKCA